MSWGASWSSWRSSSFFLSIRVIDASALQAGGRAGEQAGAAGGAAPGQDGGGDKAQAHHLILQYSQPSTETEFLDEIQTKFLRVFLLAIHRHLYSLQLSLILLFLQTHGTSYSFYKEERRKN
jgi:hypothetical protein